MKKKKVWFFIIGIVILSIVAFMIYSNQGETVDLVKVEKGNIQKYIEDIGTVNYKDLVNVSIEGNGFIKSISADVGQHVKKGDKLLLMENEELEIQLKNLDEKSKEIQAGFQGSEIKNYATNVEKATIALNQAKDAYKLATEEFKDAQVLEEIGAISSEELEQREREMKNAEILMKTAELDLKQIKANTSDSIKAVYRAQLEQVELSRESILNSIEKQEVTAPVDGIIMVKNVETNTMGVPGTVAFVIGNADNVEIEANILADDVINIKKEDQVEITDRSQDKKKIVGKVVDIAPSAVAVTSSLGVNQKRVAITIEPLEQLIQLKHGYEVDIKVITETRSDVILVPLSSVFEYQEKDCVFVVADEKAVLRTVEKGMQDEEFVEIQNGLEEGELVLKSPDINVKEGMGINLKKSLELE